MTNYDVKYKIKEEIQKDIQPSIDLSREMYNIYFGKRSKKGWNIIRETINKGDTNAVTRLTMRNNLDYGRCIVAEFNGRKLYTCHDFTNIHINIQFTLNSDGNIKTYQYRNNMSSTTIMYTYHHYIKTVKNIYTGLQFTAYGDNGTKLKYAL